MIPGECEDMASAQAQERRSLVCVNVWFEFHFCYRFLIVRLLIASDFLTFSVPPRCSRTLHESECFCRRHRLRQCRQKP